MKTIFLLAIIVTSISCGSCGRKHISVGPSVPRFADILPYHLLTNANDLDTLLRSIGNARVVLLGESTHGTKEFYTTRALITEKLITEKQFNVIAVEGDWADNYMIDEILNHDPADTVAIRSRILKFARWPKTLWANEQVLEFVKWLAQHIKTTAYPLHFYGIDLYNFWEPLNRLPSGVSQDLLASAKQVTEFFGKYKGDALLYSKDPAAFSRGSGLVAAFRKTATDEIKRRRLSGTDDCLLLQVSELLFIGERYFRLLRSERPTALNSRDEYMAETIKRLINCLQPDAKIAVWLHNTHAGNVIFSAYNSNGSKSVATLLKTAMGNDAVFSVGFGTYKGTVLAGYSWYAPMTVRKVLPAKEGTWEDILHKVDHKNKILISSELVNDPRWDRWTEFRSIGVTYQDAALYSKSIIPRRFDAFVFIDSTTAVEPLVN